MTHDPLPNRSEPLPDERYYSGEEGDQWSDILHAAIAEISKSATVSGPSRGAFDPVEGQVYIPTTPEGTISIGTGEEWIELGQLIDLSSDVEIGGDVSAASHSVGEFTITDDGDFALKAGALDHIRQPESEPTQFVQGAEIGSVEAPMDTLTQLINASATTDASAGEQVGYTFALNSQTALAVKGEADGSGGITNITFGFHSENGQIAELDETGDLRISGEIEEGAIF